MGLLVIFASSLASSSDRKSRNNSRGFQRIRRSGRRPPRRWFLCKVPSLMHKRRPLSRDHGLWRARRVAGRKAPQIRRVDKRKAPAGGISLRPICTGTRRLISADTKAEMTSRSTAIDSFSFHRATRDASPLSAAGRASAWWRLLGRRLASVPQLERIRSETTAGRESAALARSRSTPSATSIFSDSARGRRRLNWPFRRHVVHDATSSPGEAQRFTFSQRFVKVSPPTSPKTTTGRFNAIKRIASDQLN